MSGSKPITDFLGDQIALKEDGGVIVDDFMSTNSDGVWPHKKYTFQTSVVAASDGCIAAMSIDRYLNSRKNIRVDWIPLKRLKEKTLQRRCFKYKPLHRSNLDQT